MPIHAKVSPFSVHLRLAVALVCALVAVFSAYVFAEKGTDRAHESRYQSRLLAAE